jgi:hypothetical protein
MDKILIIIVINLIFYFKTLRFGYVSDDITTSRVAKTGKFWVDAWRQFRGFCYFDSKFEHLTSLILHTINCVLIYIAFGCSDISFWAAMLFGINPANYQGGIWLSGRGYAQSASCALLIMLTSNPLFYFAGLFLGVSIFPAAFLKIQWIPFALLWAVLIIMKLPGNFGYFANRSGISEVMRGFKLERVIIAVKTFGYYLQFCLFPRRLGMYHTSLYTFGMNERENERWLKLDLFFWSSFIGLGIFLYLLASDLFGVSYYLWWYLIFIGIWCNLLPMHQQPIAERFVYVANIGLMMAVSTIFYEYAGYILVYYAARNWLQMEAYRDNQAFLEFNVSKNNFPKSIFGWRIKGEHERYDLNRHFKALETWYEGFKVDKEDSVINWHIAKTLCEMSKFDDAKYHLDIAKKNKIEYVKDAFTETIPLIEELIKKRGLKCGGIKI